LSDWTEDDFASAVAYLRSLRPVTEDEFATLAVEEQARAFTVARVMKLTTIQSFLDKLIDAFQRGLTPDEFAAEVATLDLGLSEPQVEQVFSENVQRAFGAGAWDYAHASSTANLWGWKYYTQRDERVRLTHALLDGSQFELDGRGDGVFPPWDWGCRCYATWITKDGAPPKEDEVPGDVDRDLLNTDYASPAIDNEYTPDLTDYDPRLIAKYVGDQEGA